MQQLWCCVCRLFPFTQPCSPLSQCVPFFSSGGDGDSGGLSSGAKAGIAIGAILFAAALAAAGFLWYRHRESGGDLGPSLPAMPKWASAPSACPSTLTLTLAPTVVLILSLTPSRLGKDRFQPIRSLASLLAKPLVLNGSCDAVIV